MTSASRSRQLWQCSRQELLPFPRKRIRSLASDAQRHSGDRVRSMRRKSETGCPISVSLSVYTLDNKQCEYAISEWTARLHGTLYGKLLQRSKEWPEAPRLSRQLSLAACFKEELTSSLWLCRLPALGIARMCCRPERETITKKNAIRSATLQSTMFFRQPTRLLLSSERPLLTALPVGKGKNDRYPQDVGPQCFHSLINI